MFRFRDFAVASKIVAKLKELNLRLTLMHVCGTHQDTLVRFGLADLLTEVGIDIRQGPGCPVCVTTPTEIEEAIALAKSGKKVITYGDMMRVPGKTGSLSDTRAAGCDVQVVYSIDEAVKIAVENPQKNVVFVAIGFETTAPSTATALLSSPPRNFSILCCHRLIPPALDALLSMGEVKLDGIIEPGHVSTVIGAEPYRFLSEKYHIPQVIAGFEPLDLLMAVYLLARQIINSEAKVEIEYTRSVRWEGNPKAVQFMKEVFEPCAVGWRGFPAIPGSGLTLRNEFKKYDARELYQDCLSGISGVEFEEPKGCRCGEVLRGVIQPVDCPLFGKRCTPQTPVGPCMVSTEGGCNIIYKYGNY